MKNIFISSTFRDMQAERDMVQEVVLPALREEARKYGDNVGVIDLRWGVDTSSLETDEGSAKVLSVCLDEIDRSHPYMLIFLGDRYGWIPDGKLIEKAICGRGDKYVTDDFEKSVTALEIEYGALSEKYGSPDRCIVCFREPVIGVVQEGEEAVYQEQNEKALQKLKALKQRMQAEFGDKIISYTCTWSPTEGELADFRANGMPLSEVLIQRYTELFREDWKEYEAMSWQDKEQLAFRSLMESKLRSFVGRETLLQTYYEKAVSDTKPLILKGKVGSGKTALMCKLIERLNLEGKRVFPFFSGMGAMSGSAEQLVKQMVYYLEEQLGIAEHFGEKEKKDENTWGIDDILSNAKKEESLKYADWQERLKQLLGMLPEGERVYFCIDALDQLYQDEHTEKLDFLFMGRNVQFILSCTDTFALHGAVTVLVNVEEIPALDREDAKAVAQEILASNSRNAYEAIIQEILDKKNIDNPLYVSLLIQRLNMMDAVELYGARTEAEIVALATGIIRNMPDELETAAYSIVENGIDKITDREGELREVVRFLAVSRSGLRMQDLQAIFERQGRPFLMLDVSRLIKYLDSFFYINEDDTIGFTHKVIRQGLLAEIEDKQSYEKQIGDYLETLEITDVLRMREGMHYARLLEHYDSAKELLVYASRNRREEVLKSIKEEGLADDGAFYCRVISEMAVKPVTEIQNFFMNRFPGLYDLSAKEYRVIINVAKAMLDYNEQMYKKAVTERNTRMVAISCDDVGHYLRSLGDVEEALKYCEKSLEYSEKACQFSRSRVNLETLIGGYGNLGTEIRILGRAEEALGYARKALACAEELHETYDDRSTLRELAVCTSNMGHAFYKMEEYEKALRYYQRGLKRSEELLEKDYSMGNLARVGSFSCNISRTLRKMKRLEEALPYSERDVKCSREAYESTRSMRRLRDLAISLDDLGTLLQELGRGNECLECWLDAFEYHKKLNDELQTEKSLLELSECSYKIGRFLKENGLKEKAEMFYETDLRCVEKIYALRSNLKNLELLASSCFNYAALLESLDKLDEALEYFQRATTCRKTLAEKDATPKRLFGCAACYYRTGNIYKKKNNIEEAIKCFGTDVALTRGAYEMDPNPDYQRAIGDSAAEVGLLLRQIGRPKEAVEYLKMSVECRKAICEMQETERMLMDLSLSYFRLGKALEDLKEYREAVSYFVLDCGCIQRLYEKYPSVSNLRTLSQSAYNLARTLKNTGRLDESIQYYEVAMKALRELQVKEPTEKNLDILSLCYLDIGRILEAKKQFEQAQKFYEMELQVSRDKCALRDSEQNRRDLAFSYNNLGKHLEDMGKVGEAIGYYEMALSIREDLLESNRNEKAIRAVYTSYVNMAFAFRALGADEECLEFHKKALQCAQEMHKINPSADNEKSIYTCYSNISAAFMRLNMPVESWQYYEKSLALKEKACADDPTTEERKTLPGVLEWGGDLLRTLGRVSESVCYYERALSIMETVYAESKSEQDREHCLYIKGKLAEIYKILSEECMRAEEKDAGDACTYLEKALVYTKDTCIAGAKPDAYRKYVRVLVDLAKCFRALGKTEEALLHLGVAKKEAEDLFERTDQERDLMLLEEIQEMLE